jgi:Xaa-Pro aminopeptidase
MGHRSRLVDRKRFFEPRFIGKSAELRQKTRERTTLNSIIAIILLTLFTIYACQPQSTSNDDPLAGYEWRYSSDELRFDGPSPWPEIRKERIQTLLPVAMERAGVDGWAIVCRSNDNDPLARHVGCENAVSPAVVYFEKRGDEVYSMIFSPPGEATALQEIALHDTVVVVGRSPGAIAEAAAYINSNLSGKLALNFSSSNEIADGLSFSQYQALTGALNSRVRAEIVSSQDVVYEWLSVKTPAEVEILRRAAELTVRFELLAYAQVQPGVSTDADVARFLKQLMQEHGVKDAWSPDQNPAINSGVDRGHSHPTDKIIQPGDVIQTDFGIRVYDMWVTDIQRFAYVLREGETAPPSDIQRYWEVAREGNRKVLAAMAPSVTGVEVDRIQRDWMRENGSMEVMWNTGHPVGYVAHDVGPSLGGAQAGREPSATAFKPLVPGNVFAYDGFYTWEIEGGTKTISVEEMAVITENGAEYLVAPQEELVLIW